MILNDHLCKILYFLYTVFPGCILWVYKHTTIAAKLASLFCVLIAVLSLNWSARYWPFIDWKLLYWSFLHTMKTEMKSHRTRHFISVCIFAKIIMIFRQLIYAILFGIYIMWPLNINNRPSWLDQLYELKGLVNLQKHFWNSSWFKWQWWKNQNAENPILKFQPSQKLCEF